MESENAVWLSGTIQTFLNKLVFPVIWGTAMVGIPVWVFLQTGRLGIAKGFEFIVAFCLVGSVVMGWLTAHIQSVGYVDRELIVANYWREARVPFTQVEAVENVWWYRGRLVRIRFRAPTPFGQTVYYLPKWGGLRAMFSSPAKELAGIIEAAGG